MKRLFCISLNELLRKSFSSFYFLVLLFLLLFVYQSNSQITDVSRDQPLLKHTSVTLNCCKYLENVFELLKCSNESSITTYPILNNENNNENNNNPSIVFVSYSTNGILDYGSYSLAINTYYSEFNHYGMILLTPEQGAEYEPRDQRWNKVKILIDALISPNGWARNVDYIIWLDSDLIFLDMGMKFEQITQQYSSYDMIFSADGNIENGIVNSGLFLVKNSEWSINFLLKWWNSYDRVTGMDQHIFTRVWEETKDVKDHILILRPDALNSHLPAWTNQKDYNQILHLAGASGLLRKIIFKQGFETICKSLEDNKILPQQLGLNQNYLLQIEKNIPRGELIKQILDEMNGKFGKDLQLSEIKRLHSSLIDILQMGFERSEEDSIDEIPNQILNGLLWSFNMYYNITIHNRHNVLLYMESIQHTLDAMFNLVMRLNRDDSKALEILLQVNPLIDNLLKLVRKEHYGPALYYKFKQQQFIAINYELRNELNLAFDYYKKTMDVFWEMHKYKSYGSGNGAQDPYTEGCEVLTSLAALSHLLNHLDTCLESIQHTISFYNEIWLHRSIVPIPVLRKHAMRLSIAGSCAADHGFKSDLARKYLTESLTIYKSINEDIQNIKLVENVLSLLSSRPTQFHDNNNDNNGNNNNGNNGNNNGNKQIHSIKIDNNGNNDNDGNTNINVDNSNHNSQSRRIYRRKKKI